jgi:TrpR-related protein YerC/YecD
MKEIYYYYLTILYYYTITVIQEYKTGKFMSNDDHDSDIELFDTFLLLKNSDGVKRFLTDLCTPKEIKALKERWRVCKLLEQGDLSYRDINKITKASLTTIGRVARFLREEPYKGYKVILERLKTRRI